MPVMLDVPVELPVVRLSLQKQGLLQIWCASDTRTFTHDACTHTPLLPSTPLISLCPLFFRLISLGPFSASVIVRASHTFLLTLLLPPCSLSRFYFLSGKQQGFGRDRYWCFLLWHRATAPYLWRDCILHVDGKRTVRTACPPCFSRMLRDCKHLLVPGSKLT